MYVCVGAGAGGGASGGVWSGVGVGVGVGRPKSQEGQNSPHPQYHFSNPLVEVGLGVGLPSKGQVRLF